MYVFQMSYLWLELPSCGIPTVLHCTDSTVLVRPTLCHPAQEHRDLTDNAWQKLTGVVADGEGLLKEAKELLWEWPLPPVSGVGMDTAEMDQLGRCSKAIKVSHSSKPTILVACTFCTHLSVSVLSVVVYLSCPSLHPCLPQNFFSPDMLYTFDSIKEDLLAKIHHSTSPVAQAPPSPSDPTIPSASTAPPSPSHTQVSPIHVTVSEEDLERTVLLWNEGCQESRWLVDSMDLLSKLVPLRCTAMSDIDRCRKGAEFCAGMAAVEEQLSLHAVSAGHTSHALLQMCNVHTPTQPHTF